MVAFPVWSNSLILTCPLSEPFNTFLHRLPQKCWHLYLIKCGVAIGKLWPLSQIQPLLSFVSKVLLEHPIYWPHPFVYILVILLSSSKYLLSCHYKKKKSLLTFDAWHCFFPTSKSHPSRALKLYLWNSARVLNLVTQESGHINTLSLIQLYIPPQ